jgi:hypothetical protein
MTTTTDIKKRIFDSLKRGTGEAYLLAKENPTIDFSTYVIKGALRNYAYDGQSESSRAQYILDLYSISDRKDKIRKAILNGLETEQEDTWSLTHLFDLAKLFAQQGDQEMRNAIYERFCNNPIEGSDWVGYSEILELDGFKGLIYIAEKFGKYIEQNPEDWQDDSILTFFQEENPDLKVNETLETLAKENKYIHIYLENIKRTKANHEKPIPKQIKYKDIVDEVLNTKPFISFRRKRNLTEEEINQVTKQLLNETDKSNIERFLVVFDYCKYPYDSQLILNFAKQKPTNKNRIVEYAINSLKHLKSKDIRNFAIAKIQSSKNPIEYLKILVSNYKSGDHKLLSHIATQTNNEHKIEWLAGIYSDIYKANKTKECKEPLEILYYKMNCGIHRHEIVEILIENEVLSDKIRAEIRFDSYMETRELLKE